MKNQVLRQDLIELDGSHGEGGGQVLRTALALSMITGTPFKIERVRAKRSKPGLLRQHLTAVLAASTVSNAKVQGAKLGSQALRFEPGPIRAGDYRFAIGSAGSSTLVLQTILPALWFANGSSTVSVSGGTHNKAAPPADFLIRCWLPLLARMGVTQSIRLNRHGFYPAGGGEVLARIEGSSILKPITLLERGERQALCAEALVAGVPSGIARRELDKVTEQLDCTDSKVRELPQEEGPGNVLMIEARYAEITELFTAFGERGISAETVAATAVQEALQYLQSSAVVGEYLADQLLLPMALAGGGAFTATTASSHLRTNITVIEKFLPVEIQIHELDGGVVRIEIS
ncbi:RNA 3'-terminal phosphate cyclase [Chitinimonas sp. PSY-7]|uniref:RNA 3'-terminal phosphate cyclase n=1 Tax=Chitinimonas sp. PSY-7 TaxID=3459088 RepID=UPI0040400989